MTTKLAIFNLAASHLAIGRAIGAVDEATAPARACEQFYDQVVAEVFREFNWPAARKLAALTLVAGDVSRASLDYQYSYRYPVDCLFAREVLIGSRRPSQARSFHESFTFDARSARIPFWVGSDGTGLLIFTDAQPIAATATTVALPQLEYTVLIPEAQFAPDMTQAIAFLLAWYVAPVITAGDPAKLGDRARAAYEWAIARAHNTARNEQEDDDEPESSFITARN